MARVKKIDLDALIGEAWHRLASGVTVTLLDIPRIFRDVQLEMSAGATVDDAVRAVIPRYQVSDHPARCPGCARCKRGTSTTP